MDSGIQSTLKSLAKHLLAALVLYFPLVTASASLEFSDQTAISGVAPPFLADIPAGGIAVADFDGNGYPDIFVTGYLLDNRIHFNQGDGTFVENPDINAMVAGNRCSVAAAADYNNDGWPDIYVGCRNQSNLLLKNLEGKGFSNEIVPELDHSATGANSSRTDAVAWGDLTGNGHLDLFIGVYPASSQPDLNDPDNIDRIVLNHGDGTWTNIAEAFTGEARAKSARTTLAVAISDLDHNGQPDIYVVNDKLQGNLLWRNDGAGCGGLCLTERSAQSGVSRPVFGMGIGLGDVDRDGRWDMYFSSIDEQVLMRGQSATPLFFAEDTDSALNHLAVGWGTIFADFDNDGWEDAFLAVNSGSFSTSSNSDQLFSNQGDGTFVSVISGSGLETIRPTEAAAIIDFDLDGRLDLVLGHWNQDPGYRLYRNVTPATGNWIGFRLQGGDGINRDAIGTRITLDDGSGTTQIRELRAGESRGSSHHPVLHFGLGEATSADVTVRWPDGLSQTFEDMSPGNYHVLAYPGAEIIFQDRFDQL